MPTTRPYGSWPSIISSELLVDEVVRLSDVRVSGAEVWWNEGRPSESGRQVLVSSTDGGRPTDRLPAGFSCRTAVHEYGGAGYALVRDPAGDAVTAVFANWTDQSLWTVSDGEPVRLTPEPSVPRGVRFADLSVVPGNRWVLAVRERHLSPSAGADGVANDIVAVSLPSDGGVRGEPDIKVIADGHDFFSSPRPSPDGRRVAWVAWDHPSMPWDSTELWVADLGGDGTVGVASKVAGGPGQSVGQPRWSPDGRLHFVSDRTGWWNIYGEHGTPAVPLDAEFAGPDWVFGQSSYTFLEDGRLVVTWSAEGGQHIGLVDDGRPVALDLPYSAFESLQVSGSTVVAVAGSPTSEPAVVRIGVDNGAADTLRHSRDTSIDEAWIAVPEPIEFPTEGGERAHALWYPPTNPDTDGPGDERPPLMVVSHGGPTSSTRAVLDYRVQYWTSRGFGVVDVDYGGSTGYGRPYRERLKGAWGIVDVDDCVGAATWLADRGSVDGDRMVIRGGSAGGYTTLAALTFRDAFAAGASHFGVADLELLARDTHKFESRYLDGLIGPYPETADIYRERSPIHHVAQLRRPLILFQGLDDRVVLPAQAALIADALAQQGVPVTHLTFPGEKHGFRQAQTIRRVIDTELAFYGRVLGFATAQPDKPFVIVNEDAIQSG